MEMEGKDVFGGGVNLQMELGMWVEVDVEIEVGMCGGGGVVEGHTLRVLVSVASRGFVSYGL